MKFLPFSRVYLPAVISDEYHIPRGERHLVLAFDLSSRRFQINIDYGLYRKKRSLSVGQPKNDSVRVVNGALCTSFGTVINQVIY